MACQEGEGLTCLSQILSMSFKQSLTLPTLFLLISSRTPIFILSSIPMYSQSPETLGWSTQMSSLNSGFWSLLAFLLVLNAWKITGSSSSDLFGACTGEIILFTLTCFCYLWGVIEIEHDKWFLCSNQLNTMLKFGHLPIVRFFLQFCHQLATRDHFARFKAVNLFYGHL